MQHAHILAPPTRTAGWYLRVRQSETIYHLRTPQGDRSGDRRVYYCGHRCCLTM
ncbi:unnamed protein product [Acanthoscelides obtectus]|uniref:Uncharacterized protein n=1 Tax=Acanthoscelides obtectus TaxID=200917 RepID=A0A9P0P5Z4_ACAOB|nr:unnamed protein product [Acanthoscelides obtectus]CAK1655473.1 hypothetical protein AOBTE_LOCUS19185 [Acanthoscelides obtectus]